MTRTRGLLNLTPLLFLVASGCLETAHYVALDANGGVVGIPSRGDRWPTNNRNAAEELMSQKCPQGYVVDHEQAVAIGQTTTENSAGNNQSLSSTVFGLGAATHSTETLPINEWQITFHGLPAEPQHSIGPKPQSSEEK